MNPPLPPARVHQPTQPLRWPAAVGVALAVLLLHAAVLGLLPVAPGPGWQGQTQRPMQVRQLAAPPAAAAARTEPPQALALARPQQRAADPRKPAAADTDPPSAAAAVMPPPEAQEPAAARAGSDTQPGGAAVPVYATRLPPAVQLRYELRRGQQRGHALLNWSPAGDSFELTLANEWTGGPNAQGLGSSSRGHITGTGLAPERHTESRRGRDVRTVNFQYDSARITFSGPSVEYPLVAGAQDRLSWMLQLAAIIEANPALQAPGSEVVMFVAGSRGDGEVWAFVVQDPDAIELPAGPLPQPVHLKREPRRPYDTLVEVWLDPARGHLPVRMRQFVRPTGQGMEILLETMSTP